jgi:hypothetical protein
MGLHSWLYFFHHLYKPHMGAQSSNLIGLFQSGKQHQETSQGSKPTFMVSLFWSLILFNVDKKSDLAHLCTAALAGPFMFCSQCRYGDSSGLKLSSHFWGPDNYQTHYLYNARLEVDSLNTSK